MKIVGIEGLGYADVEFEIARGGKFVIYQYCISVLILTFRRNSDVHFVKADRNRVAAGVPFTVMTLFLGWWGIPWGPIYSITSLATNFGGGKDVTPEVQQILRRGAAQSAAGTPPPLP